MMTLLYHNNKIKTLLSKSEQQEQSQTNKCNSQDTDQKLTLEERVSLLETQTQKHALEITELTEKTTEIEAKQENLDTKVTLLEKTKSCYRGFLEKLVILLIFIVIIFIIYIVSK